MEENREGKTTKDGANPKKRRNGRIISKLLSFERQGPKKAFDGDFVFRKLKVEIQEIVCICIYAFGTKENDERYQVRVLFCLLLFYFLFFVNVAAKNTRTRTKHVRP